LDIQSFAARVAPIVSPLAGGELCAASSIGSKGGARLTALEDATRPVAAASTVGGASLWSGVLERALNLARSLQEDAGASKVGASGGVTLLACLSACLSASVVQAVGVLAAGLERKSLELALGRASSIELPHAVVVGRTFFAGPEHLACLDTGAWGDPLASTILLAALQLGKFTGAHDLDAHVFTGVPLTLGVLLAGLDIDPLARSALANTRGGVPFTTKIGNAGVCSVGLARDLIASVDSIVPEAFRIVLALLFVTPAVVAFLLASSWREGALIIGRAAFGGHGLALTAADLNLVKPLAIRDNEASVERLFGLARGDAD